MAFTHDRSNGQLPHRLTVSAHHVVEARNESFRANDSVLSSFNVPDPHEPKSWLEMKTRYPGFAVYYFVAGYVNTVTGSDDSQRTWVHMGASFSQSGWVVLSSDSSVRCLCAQRRRFTIVPAGIRCKKARAMGKSCHWSQTTAATAPNFARAR